MEANEDRYDVAGMSATPLTESITRTTRPLAWGVGAGLAAAVVGGVAWALIVKSTDYEVGILAWAIGFIVGTAAVFATRGGTGRQLQVVAVVLALTGILLGKYLGYALILQEEAQTFGEEIGLFSSTMLEFFREDLDLVFGLFDLLWVGLAVASAWRITQVREPELPPGPPKLD
jgi:hypothetical protein